MTVSSHISHCTARRLRVLIDRSLLLGTIDRPSAHDLVLDFAIAQHSKVDLCEKHRSVVEALRAARPADAHGRLMFTGENSIRSTV